MPLGDGVDGDDCRRCPRSPTRPTRRAGLPAATARSAPRSGSGPDPGLAPTNRTGRWRERAPTAQGEASLAPTGKGEQHVGHCKGDRTSARGAAHRAWSARAPHVRLGPIARDGVEPPRGAADRGGPGSGQHRPVCVPPGGRTRSTIVANYIPLEEPAGGPNFAQFDDDVLYEIRSTTTATRTRTSATSSGSRPRSGTRTRSSTTRAGSRRSTTRRGTARRPTRSRASGTTTRARVEQARRRHPTPPVNIGPRSTPDVGRTTRSRRRRCKTVGGDKVFAGQRDDPFFVDLGSIFDLGGLRPFNPFHLIPLAAATVWTEWRATTRTRSRSRCRSTAARSRSPATRCLGVYASASRKSVRIREEGRHVDGAGHVGAGLAPRQPADQRGDHPARARRTTGTRPTRRTTRSSHQLHEPGAAGADQSPLPGAPEHVQTTGRNDLVAVLLTGVGPTRRSA